MHSLRYDCYAWWQLQEGGQSVVKRLFGIETEVAVKCAEAPDEPITFAPSHDYLFLSFHLFPFVHVLNPSAERSVRTFSR